MRISRAHLYFENEPIQKDSCDIFRNLMRLKVLLSNHEDVYTLTLALSVSKSNIAMHSPGTR